MNPNRLSQIIRNLTLPIPKPYRPPPKPQDSWRLLKSGNRLLAKKPYASGGDFLSEGDMVEVEGCDSQGVWLTAVSGNARLGRIRWETPDWKGSFEKVKVRIKKGE
jgi:hypothetical protein